MNLMNNNLSAMKEFRHLVCRIYPQITIIR